MYFHKLFFCSGKNNLFYDHLGNRSRWSICWIQKMIQKMRQKMINPDLLRDPPESSPSNHKTWKWPLHNSHLLSQRAEPLLLVISSWFNRNQREEYKGMGIFRAVQEIFSLVPEQQGDARLRSVSRRGCSLVGFAAFSSFSRSPDPTEDTLKSPSTRCFIFGSIRMKFVLNSTA